MSQDDAQIQLEQFWMQKLSLDADARQFGRPRAVPVEVYPLLCATLDRILALAAPGRYSIALTEAEYLLNAARNMSILAVRENDNNWLRYGLLALVVERCTFDYRETISDLSLLDNSARRLGVDLSDTWRGVESIADDNVRTIVLSFLNRSSEEKAIHHFGFVEVIRASGFDYKRKL